MKSDDVFQYFINSYLSLVEPHTGYMEPITSENFEINMKLSLEGIGAVLGNDGEYTSIQTIVKGGPADLEGSLKSGDKVLAVGQDDEGSFEDVVGWSIDQSRPRAFVQSDVGASTFRGTASSPLMIFMRVDLPLPLAPMRP